ncbi:MAG TPA: patatin-like phospholipase family protein [Chitinophagaceae bacterium]
MLEVTSELPANVTSNKDCEAIYPRIPFQNIALTFSGGGFRAASFSLGVLSYLNRCSFTSETDRLLNHVKFITSTSGGSITNGLFSISVYKDPSFSFEDFYAQLRKSMDGEVLLKKVFSILNDDKQWDHPGGDTKGVRKSRNLINAFAKAYDQLLFDGKTLECIYSCTTNPFLEEVCFNCTEFNNGLNFYFQVDGQNSKISPYGNSYLKFNDPAIISKLKIGDIVAASSCFPGGFEPIIYPNDFVHEGLTDVNSMLHAVSYKQNNPLQLDQVKNKSFALMDGGIVDNMGINAVMVEDEKRMNGKGRFDLILACDVTSYFNSPLERQEGEVKKETGFGIQSVINIFKYSVLLFILCLVSIIFQIVPVAGYIFLLPSLIMTIIYFYCKGKLSKMRSSQKSDAFGMALKYLDYFLKLPFPVINKMLKARMNSVVKLVGDLFLKQIRRGQYDNLFTKPRLVYRTISCLVYEFSDAHELRRVSILENRDKAWWPSMSKILMPSPKMQKVANSAKNTGTTLWFDETDVKEEKRDAVIASGQFTACYNLIKHICRLEILEPKYKQDADLQKLKSRLLKDWASFQEDPMFMIENTNELRNVNWG